MSERRQRRRRRQRSPDSGRKADSGIPQLPSADTRSPFAPLAALSAEQVEQIHDASMRLLEEQGIEVLSARARALFRQAGADVDESSCVVRGPRELFLQALGHAPESFTLTPRNPRRAITIGGDHIHFGFVSGPPNIHDRVNGRRQGNIADYRRLLSLAQYFNVITFLGNQATAPVDLPANTRHLDTYREAFMLTDKVFSAVPIGTGRVRDAVEMAALARGMSVPDLAADPTMITNININSPRRIDESMADAAIYMAEHGQAVIVTPFTLMGAMTPATLSGALVQQNAEAVFGLAMVQLAGPGAPCVYGGFTSNVDMRSGAPAFGTPENALANVAGGQLARRYGLPYRSSACNAANTVDAQAVYESQAALWGAVMGHANIIYHAAGWLEGGLVASFEKVVIDVESLQAMARFLRPVEVSENEIGLDAIAEVGPGGHFFGAAHTMARYRDAFYQPLLSDWRNHESWEQAGAHDAAERATAIWQKALQEFEPPPLDPARRDALDDYVARRREAIGNDEP
ncbi:MAG TPA: trimethylamine methyltransferase family protein [Arenicellales bacterium]|nr:trimethylamine methyltransferase family protein [Arenicellales bacterium]